MTTGFALRAPWYVRERPPGFDLRDPRALRPEIQMYDDTDFVQRLTRDPGTPIKFGLDDNWSYPIPVTPLASAKGRERFATSKLVHTQLRKLYQPSHSRFYAVVVEVFCDSAGLPRAGLHDDFDVTFVLRRQDTKLAGTAAQVRQLARKLLKEMAQQEHPGHAVDKIGSDGDDLWWAGEASRLRFEEDNAELITDVKATTAEQAWTGASWAVVPDEADLVEDEEHLPMWRLPARDEDCQAATTRSLWFGLVPTYSSEHWTDPTGTPHAKLDDHTVYQLRCAVTQRPAPGHEHCPPKVTVSHPTEPFRLAAAYDPDGTKNRTISVTAPDLRRLAARAGQKQGPGGLRITTPPGSSLGPVDFKAIPGVGIGTVGGGGSVESICSFAFELFFIVAFFLFLLFLPIVVLVFQLWWMLALRFCIPPSLSFNLLAAFFAGGGTLAQLAAPGGDPTRLARSQDLDRAIGVTNSAAELIKKPSSSFDAPTMVELVAALNPDEAQADPAPPVHLTTPADPLCPL